MLSTLITSAVRRKMIGLFVLNSSFDFYARHIAKEIHESPHAVGLELRRLLKGKIIQKVEKDGRCFYHFNSNHPCADDFKSMITKLHSMGDVELCAIPNMEHRELINDNIGRIVDGLKKYYDPEKVILFGSAVLGKTSSTSDIDLVIIKKTSLPFLKRSEQLAELIDYDVDVDFLVYTPEEFKRAVNERPFFKNEIIKKGKVIYEKAA